MHWAMESVEPASSSSTSLSLIKRACAKDPEAWLRLSRVYIPLVYGWTRRAGLPPADAADCVQEVFGSVFANVAGFQYDQANASFRGWLWTVTRNQVRLHYRQLGKRPEAIGGSEHQRRIEEAPDVLEQESAPSTEMGERGLLRRAVELMQGDFEEKTWKAFWRMTVDGDPAADIAEDLGMTPKAVRQAKYRVLARLREELADRDPS
jgi:RNA polymerase sigma-70 factor (ECF subfamily)